jgi:hypothetical protein
MAAEVSTPRPLHELMVRVNAQPSSTRGLVGLAAPLCHGDRSARSVRAETVEQGHEDGTSGRSTRTGEQQMRTRVAYVAADVLDTEQRGDGHRRIHAGQSASPATERPRS